MRAMVDDVRSSLDTSIDVNSGPHSHRATVLKFCVLSVELKLDAYVRRLLMRARSRRAASSRATAPKADGRLPKAVYDDNGGPCGTVRRVRCCGYA